MSDAGRRSAVGWARAQLDDLRDVDVDAQTLDPGAGAVWPTSMPVSCRSMSTWTGIDLDVTVISPSSTANCETLRDSSQDDILFRDASDRIGYGKSRRLSRDGVVALLRTTDPTFGRRPELARRVCIDSTSWIDGYSSAPPSDARRRLAIASASRRQRLPRAGRATAWPSSSGSSTPSTPTSPASTTPSPASNESKPS